MSKFIDLTGKVFGKLIVLEKSKDKKYINGEILWKCKCQCPKQSIVLAVGSALRSGGKKSCGCIWKPTKEEYKKKIKDRLEERSRWNNQCQEWIGFKDKDGYGKITLTENGVELPPISVHRLSWLIHVGIIPDGMCVCHKCDNPSCFRPSHLFLGTHKDNMQDKMKKERHTHLKGEKNPLSKITQEQAIEILEFKGKGISSHELCKKYSIAASTVRSIWQRKNWKHLELLDENDLLRRNI